MDRVEIHDLRVEAILGILDREQHTPQPLVADLVLELDLGVAGETGALDASVDYGAISEQVAFLVTHGRFRLLETMALAIARLILLPPAPREARAPVAAVEVALKKPAVLAGLAVPGVRIRRTATALVPPVPHAPGMQLDRLCATSWNAAWRVRLDPGVPFHAPAHVAAHPIAEGAVLAVAHPPWP